MHERFVEAVWRFTAWCTLILFLLGTTFSGIVYTVATSELRNAIAPSSITSPSDIFLDSDAADIYRQQKIDQSAHHLFISLGIFTFAIVALGSIASYLYARQALRPIMDAAELQSRFTSDAAHELKTPLTIMQTEIEVALRKSSTTKTDYRTILTSNLEEVERLRARTDRLLLLAHDQPLELESVATTDIVATALGRVRSQSRQADITISSTAKPARVIAHHESLVDVLVILIDNAIKYSQPYSHITLTSRNRHGDYELRVSDEGSGIDARDQPYIFDRFYRADTSRTNSHINGAGLGLALARQLMTLQHGRIALSASSARGSTFTITIPLARDH